MSKKPFKAVLVRFEPNIYKFLRQASVDQDKSMNEIISGCVAKYKEYHEKKLTSGEIVLE